MSVGRGNGRVLLNLLASRGDQNGVAHAIDQHADMVYATCRRILGNDAEAADVAQETFFHFLKNSQRIRGSVAAWLHCVATGRSIDFLRQSTARRRRESVYAADVQPTEPDEWRELEPLVDEALEALPAATRELLIEHYLDRRSMVQIGQKHGISQPTVSRRIASALEDLRTLLRNKGVLMGTATLGTLLASSAQAAPATMLQTLGKMALAEAATHGAGAAAAGSTLFGGGAKVATAVVTSVLLVGVGSQVLRPGRSMEPAPAVAPAASVSFGFYTNTSWTIGPDGRPLVVESSGTNFVITNYGTSITPPTDATLP
ncbi:MAG: RNA polymerase sigma factor [Verrucomicrobia bacterium]|nr:RNA polymerase sigma factor [Verrucomicrobiota bacterium]